MKLKWINVAKGIGIILVVLGHSNIPFEIVRYIHSFHMPLFFFISGYLYHKRDNIIFIKRKVNTLVIPYIKFSIIYLCVYIFLGHTKTDNVNFIKNTLLGQDVLLWFLVVLFFTEVIFNSINNLVNNEKVVFYIVGLIGIVGHMLSYFKIILIYRIDIVMVSTVMFYIGYITNQYIKPRINNKIINLKSFIFAVILSVGCCFTNNVKVDMRTGVYGNIILYYISALCGIYCVFYIALKIKESYILEFLGENTITIYAYNVFLPISMKEYIVTTFEILDFNIIYKIMTKILSYMLILAIIVFENYCIKVDKRKCK